MKTEAQNQLTKSLSEDDNLGLMRAIALKQYNGENYFLVDTDDGLKAYNGNFVEASYEFRTEITQDQMTFEEWCLNHLENAEVEPIEGDEERDNYIVLTDDEANERCKDYIEQSLWAFNPSFLAGETGINQDVFDAIQDNGKCESNNDAIASYIADMDSFVESAISADGRGHFMSSYDGEENEETVNGVNFYIYRIN